MLLKCQRMAYRARIHIAQTAQIIHPSNRLFDESLFHSLTIMLFLIIMEFGGHTWSVLPMVRYNGDK